MFKKNYQEAVNEIRTSQSLKQTTLEKMRKHAPERRDVRRLLAYGAAAVLVVMVTVTAGAAATKSTYATAISKPEYPKKLDFEDYAGRQERQEEIDPAFLEGLEEFSLQSSTTVLREAGSSENRLFSPISLYLALAMVAESASGETQDEVLNALHMDSLALVRSETGKLFRRLYTDNEIGRLSLGNSLWLSRDIAFHKSLLDILGKDYYAHSFSLDFKDSSSAKSVSDWVSEHTGGKLGSSPSDFNFSKDQVMTLLSTIYFYDEWQDRFDPAKTKEAPFHMTDGTSVSSDFMNMTYFSHLFAKGANYTVSSLNMKNQRSMVFILPDEGTSLGMLLEDDNFLHAALSVLSSENAAMGEVVFKIPKFNFASSLDLMSLAASMGMDQAFTDEADFSNLAETKPLYISSVSQDATIAIDENGVEAAAYTEIHWVGSAQPEGRAEMVLDRPFLFAITGVDGSPLFVGILNNPQE